MDPLFDRSIPPSKASPFVNHPIKASGPINQTHAPKPVTSTGHSAGAKQAVSAEAKKPKVKPVAVSIGTAAVMFETCTKTIRRWIESGKLQGFRVGRVIRIPVSELAKLMEKRG